MEIKLNEWAMVLFVMQCVLFFLPASVEWWMRLAPALFVCAFVVFTVLGTCMFFVYHLVRGFMMEMRRRKEMLTIPEKEE